MNMSSVEPIFAFVGGIATHLLYFKHGERHAYPWRYVFLLLTGSASIWSVKWYRMQLPILTASCQTIVLTTLYLSGLMLSLVIYRLFFNPLNKFPGPYVARLTKLYFVYINAQSGLHGHHVLHILHKQYGPYVRIGPNDLSIVDPEGMPVVLGPNSKCRKSEWYGQDMPYISTNTTRDRKLHDRRRRILTPAFTDKFLRGYMMRTQKFNELLIARIDDHEGKPMNVTKWFHLHGFDVMGDLVFNKSFNMLQSGETHWAIKLLEDGTHIQGYAFPPWLYRVFATLPGMGSGYRRFVQLCIDQLDERMKLQGKTTHMDMIEPLITHFQSLSPEDQKNALPMLQGDSRMLIVGGSDSSSTTLIHMFYRFCTEPGLAQRVRDEVAPMVSNINQIQYQDIRDAQLLHGCIKETLRMHYPAPSGFFRKTPKEGIHIGDVFIPADTVIQNPPYIVGQDENVYERCNEFIPERWYSRPEMVKRMDAYSPFLAGSEACIGKPLAYQMLSVLASQILLQFDVAFAPGEDGTTLVQESRDFSMLNVAELNLVFTRRSGE
ncbi:cytochrome p450 [Trichoderma arundinaceum]|uniref:Cytochrome p450 n=1 Tax=Trichoderma arundinaceum TaxID=490622 RepID=A0A395NYD6_TRIAR|nr:cytochrome p450 [Trichoderma arundinaceum]